MGGEEVPESSAVIWRGGAAFLNVSVDLESLELQRGGERCVRDKWVIWLGGVFDNGDGGRGARMSCLDEGCPVSCQPVLKAKSLSVSEKIK